VGLAHRTILSPNRVGDIAEPALSTYWAIDMWGRRRWRLGGTDVSHHEIIVLYATSLGSTIVFAVIFTVVTVRFERALAGMRRGTSP
jgi:hypothetical protein